jgi:alcohol dehydrogenase
LRDEVVWSRALEVNLKTRAALLYDIGLPQPYAQTKPLRIEEIDLADPGPDEVLVRIRAAGLCHSDLSVINGDRPRPLPMAIGHEASGTVEALGSSVHDLTIGQHVILVFMPSCGHCLPCASGRPALCEPGALANGAGTLLSGARRISSHGADINHHLGCSAFADFAVVSRRSLVPIDPAIGFDHAALFGCAVLTGMGAVINTAKVEAGTTVAVIGLGGVGFSSVLAALAIGASRVIAIDRLQNKLEIAKSLGASDVFDATDPDMVAKVREATGGGVDYAFEMAGSVAALDSAYRITRRGGTTVTAGLPNPAAQWSLQAVSLIAEERTVKGSYIGSCVPTRDVPRYTALFREGRLPVDKLLSEHISLNDINPALDRLARGESIRQIVMMDRT